jgi:CRISPR-associated endoribonuclease Cas6
MLDVIDYRLKLARPLNPAEATHLRGYFGSIYTDEVQLHHHQRDGTLLYEYPRVQFKVLEQAAHLIGIGEGSELVTRLWAEVEKARIRDEELPILEGSLVRRRDPLGEWQEPISYQFRTPWLGLNQDNHARFVRLRNREEQWSLLDRVLVGNCLSIAKSFGIRVRCHLTADATALRRVETRLKGVPMLGFLGTFRINFLLPDWIGIGKSVSRGFGTLQQLKS